MSFEGFFGFFFSCLRNRSFKAHSVAKPTHCQTNGIFTLLAQECSREGRGFLPSLPQSGVSAHFLLSRDGLHPKNDSRLRGLKRVCPCIKPNTVFWLFPNQGSQFISLYSFTKTLHFFPNQIEVNGKICSLYQHSRRQKRPTGWGHNNTIWAVGLGAGASSSLKAWKWFLLSCTLRMVH